MQLQYNETEILGLNNYFGILFSMQYETESTKSL